MDTDLTQQKCVPCEGNVTALTPAQYTNYLSMVPKWDVVEERKIERTFSFKDFKHAVAFVNQIADLAEKEGHHPNIYLYGWNKVKITLTTHAIKGLFINDFIMAAKIDKLTTPLS